MTGVVILACLLFAYVVVRADRIPITWDEAYNYLEFTRKGMLLPFSHFRMMAANNHYLNSWLTWLTTAVFGVSEISLRLPALLAHGLFLYCTARLCRELPSPPLRLSAFVVLNANPYVLDFFSLSRGYALGFGLMAASLWYLYRFFQADRRPTDSLKSLGLAILAVSAHLTLIDFLVSLTLVIVLATILDAPVGPGLARRVAYGLRVNAAGLVMVGVSLVPALFVIRKLRNADALFYGGSTGFWHDTFLGILNATLYGKEYPPSVSSLLGGLLLVLMAIALWVSARSFVRPAQARDRYLPALVFLVCSCALTSVAQHDLLGVLYLKSRTGVYLLILTTFMVVALADTLARKRARWGDWLVPAAVVVMAHLLNCLNLTYVLEWRVGADVKRMLADVAAAKGAGSGGGRTTTLGIGLDLEAPINFYRLVNGLTWLNVADRRLKFHPLSDFYLYGEEDWRAVNADSFAVLQTYPVTDSRLLRRKHPVAHFDVLADEREDFDAAHGNTRSGLTDERHRWSGRIGYTPDLTHVAAARSLVAVRAMIWMQSLRNARAQLVIAFDRNRQAYSRQTMTVRDDARRARTWFPVNLTGVVPPDARQGDRVSVYLENTGGPVYVGDLEMQWLTAEFAP